MPTDYNDSTYTLPKNLAELEAQLQALSHDDHAVKIIQNFAKNLGKTNQRQRLFNEKGAIVREPIIYQDMLHRGLIAPDEDPFILLQGDIVSTETAYFLGERMTQMKFAVATSTCDLIPGRRQYATLLRVQPIRKDDPNVKQLLGELLKFSSTQRMYLPPLPNDPSDIIGNTLVFDGIVQVRLDDLLVATRLASLSLVGWRIFGSIVRTIMARAGDTEVRMRSSL
ncbi:hypothetical protein G7B40_012025 [Aetokthonos hydrillicola Thurmond2011]|jgi:hypothetical protein|uniref:Uncharacterized protein n=1 Tax=Aetokthonos hydrillicola Thurmond2011 TaxID=2712845 RepID=A0AAP5I8R4_9CYAN|nr:hypothetical protein [Aetokthonos hydrillicola]MBO3459084.1 hypothetical protein [Aetokthonos hydrillicola CCALA 1050]MBW4584742.1 hypothetical protein [Aetokthonos hydrillicola CCALA 1050]MDR9895288.1 hypothetical protein [Aetokthonos hydrillicola Thurmond2011]